MFRAQILTFGCLSIATPLLVLTNSLIGSSALSFTTAIPFQSMNLGERLVYSKVGHLVSGYDLISPHQDIVPQARVISNRGQYFLEFYMPFKPMAESTRSVVYLDRRATPENTFPDRDQAVALGSLQVLAGLHQYPIPAHIDVEQYRTVVIWCAEARIAIGYSALSLPSAADKPINPAAIVGIKEI